MISSVLYHLLIFYGRARDLIFSLLLFDLFPRQSAEL